MPEVHQCSANCYCNVCISHYVQSELSCLEMPALGIKSVKENFLLFPQHIHCEASWTMKSQLLISSQISFLIELDEGASGR